jgi:hypothetical protein
MTARLMKDYVVMQPRDAAGFYLLVAALLTPGILFTEAGEALQRSLTLKADADNRIYCSV